MHKQVINKAISKFFKSKEVLSSEKFYGFVKRRKIVVYVPEDHVEKVAEEMSHAGAGRIGNYDSCSFRTLGTGTFKAGKNTNPYSGRKNALSKVSEVKLEMECNPDDVNKAIDALLKSHPYEETAYEIYDFRKREKREIGIIINLKAEMSLAGLMKRINKRLDPEIKDLNFKFRKIAIVHAAADEAILDSAKFTNCECVLSIFNKNHKLYKTH